MKKILIVTVIFSFCSVACHNFATKRIVVPLTNKSATNIFFNAQCNNADTSIIFEPETSTSVNSNADGTTSFSYSELTNKNENNVQVFLFSKDTVEKYGWDYVVKNYLVLKRYDLKVYKKKKDQDKSNNTRLVYE